MRIGIVTAVEIAAWLRKYVEKLEPVYVKGHTAIKMLSGSHELYIVQSGAGEIRAGAAVQMLISHFHVELIVNYGVVGALTEDLKATHTCVVKKCVHYDMDTSAADQCKVGRYLDYDDIYLPATPDYVEKVMMAHDSSIRPVICASGDKFIADSEEKWKLHRNFNADICDMETAAVILVCDMNQVPNLIIKTVADSIKGGAEEFRQRMEEAADTCVRIVAEVLGDLSTQNT